MPAKRLRKQQQTKADPLAESLARIANLLAILATKEMAEGDKVGLLSAVGFGNQEIARLLGKDVNTVNVFLSLRRKKSQKKKQN